MIRTCEFNRRIDFAISAQILLKYNHLDKIMGFFKEGLLFHDMFSDRVIYTIN